MSVINKKDVGQRLLVLEELFRLNTRKFSKYLNADPSYIGKVERGEKSLSKTYLDRITEVFNVSEQWLLVGQEPIFTYGTNIPHDRPGSPEVGVPSTEQIRQKLAEKYRLDEIGKSGTYLEYEQSKSRTKNSEVEEPIATYHKTVSSDLMLADLIKSNKDLADAARIQAEAAKIRAEADVVLARNVENLIAQVKSTTASDVVSTQKETVATVKALKEHLFELESQVTKKSVREIKQAFHNKVKQVKDPV